MGKNKKKHKHKQYIPKKENRFLNASLDYIHTRITNDLPYMYSAIALAMWNILDETDEEKVQDINTLLNESQMIWNDIVENGKNIVEECERITGFCMTEVVNAEREEDVN